MDAEQTSEDTAFSSALAATLGKEPSESPAVKAEDEKPVEEASTQETAEEPKQEPQSEPTRIAGFTEDELKNLFARVAKVEELEQGLRKAHGKIGELNSRLQESAKAPAPAPEQKQKSQVEEDYPDIAQWVQEQLNQKQPEPETQPEPQTQGMTAEQVQLMLMDQLDEKWKDKVASRDFNLWLAASADDVREQYQTATTAKELHKIVSSFDAWHAAKSQRTNVATQRLENAITPQGVAGKPKTAPTPDDAFRVALKSVIGR